MKYHIFLLILLISVSTLSAQDLVSDTEVKDLRARVVEVTTTLDHWIPENSDENRTYIQFAISLEIWNPYDANITSYGSSSCRWLAKLDPSFNDNFTIENYGQACTDDWSPRTFPSGLSNESSSPEILILDEHLEVLPDVVIYINDYHGDYKNKTDNFYGAKITITDGLMDIVYEELPDNWGDIYLNKMGELSLDFNAFYLIPVLLSLTTIINRKK